MRTTLNVDDDVFYAAKAVAKQTRISLGVVLSDWARRGQQQIFANSNLSITVDPVEQPQTRNGIELLPKRGVMVTSEQVHRMLGDEAA
jgi:hypothetical protein